MITQEITTTFNKTIINYCIKRNQYYALNSKNNNHLDSADKKQQAF